jgi:4-methyl-5(b-hydroxyethyl)-thiazole monophosphate biosynthesis
MRVLVPLAEGFEEIEAVTIIDVLRRADIEVVTAGVKGRNVRGSHDIVVSAESEISEIDVSDFDAVILPGGMPGSANLRENSRVISIVRDIHGRNGTVAALCAAPIVLAEAGILKEKEVTCFPGFEKDLRGANCTGEPVMVDGNIITGKGPGCAIPFSLKLVEVLSGKETADQLKKTMQVYWM